MKQILSAINFIVILSLTSASFVYSEEDVSDVVPTLINGRPANPAEFPASVWARSCSATVVGERVVFIAAHCVGDSGAITFNVGPNRYSGSCSPAREYSGNSTADYALCETNQIVTGIPYESLNSNPNLVKIGNMVLLTGYGCVRPGGSGGNDGIYRIGESRVSRLPSGNNNDIVTQGPSALCFGDSGGPAFATDPSTGKRYVISTNSRGDIQKTSYLSATHTAMAQAYFQRWYNRFGKKICGVHSDAVGCRNGSAPNSFTLDHSVANVETKIKSGYESELEKIKQDFSIVLDRFKP